MAFAPPKNKSQERALLFKPPGGQGACALFSQQALHHLLVGGLLAPQIPAEEVLVQVGPGLDVPEAAGIGADLVGQDDGTVGEAAELQLKVDELDAHLRQVFPQVLVYPEAVIGDGPELLRGGGADGGDVVL